MFTQKHASKLLLHSGVYERGDRTALQFRCLLFCRQKTGNNIATQLV